MDALRISATELGVLAGVRPRAAGSNAGSGGTAASSRCRWRSIDGGHRIESNPGRAFPRPR
jgi:hypothetical protein